MRAIAFGVPELMDGIDFLPVAIGLFGLGEVLAGAEAAERRGDGRRRAIGLRDVMPSAVDWLRSRWAIARGTVLGFFVGVLPGAGPTIATFMSYARREEDLEATRRSSATARSRASPAPSRPTTPPPPARWCRC